MSLNDVREKSCRYPEKEGFRLRNSKHKNSRNRICSVCLRKSSEAGVAGMKCVRKRIVDDIRQQGLGHGEAF